ncbi:Ubiquitin-conjugating enzyme E2-binding protein [Quillaja saponaria]|uniref:Ubiquitin-conjugating enzyme E2-binding protein n=1 Tax=Quillaja saponaria TaxID=32244 RepID=A0AAD7PEW1_QUISA|nr:Ubiquitin-conjugating enzyme E2-binding protein [Quillaja saponaria]
MASLFYPKKWRFTWEAQSHIPTLRLLLFDSHTNPSIQCRNLEIHLDPSRSSVIVSWFEDSQVSLSIPIPRVLVDTESPVIFRALEDHIEVKLVLLLPVDHPIVSSFDSALNLSEDQENAFTKPLVMDSDVKILSSEGGVDFYCRSCSFKLTRSPIRYFIEMPSVDWREVADNWFGACCCSFGGISEKLVVQYANSYRCAQSKCLLSSTSITLCKDDVVDYNFCKSDGHQEYNSVPNMIGDDDFSNIKTNSEGNQLQATNCCDPSGDILASDESSRFAHAENENLSANLDSGVSKEKFNHDGLSPLPSYLDISEDVALAHDCCRQEKGPTTTIEVLANQKSFLNGFLGNVFMVRSSYLSEDIEWFEFLCPQCSSLLGAYPCAKGCAPVDGGVRFFKCYISTCLPVGGSGDLFRKYTMERMFANQLMESANDESSFRTVVRDLKTSSLVLQIVLINPDSWSCTGYCAGTKDPIEVVPKINLHPVVKVLFSDSRSGTESQSRMIEDWTTKNMADEVFMLASQMEELMESLTSRKCIYPPSYASLQGLSLSSMPR